MRIVTICVAAAALVAATAAETGSSEQAARCASLAVPARIAGKVVCLSYGSTCRARHQARYVKFGFRCLGGYLDYDWRPLRRPLRVPTLAAGAACPASAPRGNSGGGFPGYLFGPRDPPIRHLLPARVAHRFASRGRRRSRRISVGREPRSCGPCRAMPVLYSSAVGSLTVPATLALTSVLARPWSVHPEIRLVGPEQDLHPAATFVRAAGCYAYQVDTFRSSYLIVFEASFVE